MAVLVGVLIMTVLVGVASRRPGWEQMEIGTSDSVVEVTSRSGMVLKHEAKTGAEAQAAVKARDDKVAKEQSDKEGKAKTEAEAQAAVKAKDDKVAKEQADKEAKGSSDFEAKTEAKEQTAVKAKDDKLAKEQADKEAKAKTEAEAQAVVKTKDGKLAKEQADKEAKTEAKEQAAVKAKDDKLAKEQADKEAKAKTDAEAQAAVKAKDDKLGKGQADKEAKATASRGAMQMPQHAAETQDTKAGARRPSVIEEAMHAKKEQRVSTIAKAPAQDTKAGARRPSVIEEEMHASKEQRVSTVAKAQTSKSCCCNFSQECVSGPSGLKSDRYYKQTMYNCQEGACSMGSGLNPYGSYDHTTDGECADFNGKSYHGLRC